MLWIDNLCSMTNQIPLQNGTDFNTLKTKGYYYTNTHHHNCKNIPEELKQTIFFLVVRTGYFVYQQLLYGYTGKTYYRIFNPDNNVWSSWKE